MKPYLTIIAVVTALLLGVSSWTYADVRVFEGQDFGSQTAWELAAGGTGAVTTINWDDLTLAEGAYNIIAGDRYAGLFGTPKLSVDDSGLYVGNPDPTLSDNSGFFGKDFFAKSPNNVFSPDAPPPGGPKAGPEGILTVTFEGAPMKSMGVWFLDVEGDYLHTGIEVDGTLYHFSSNQGDNKQSFLGVVSNTAFTEFKIHMSSDPYNGNGVGIDDVMYSPIPAPGAVVLGMIGLSLVGWIKKRFA